jgi:peptidoglycan/LPS O-acetylase OafA/YrhL
MDVIERDFEAPLKIEEEPKSIKQTPHLKYLPQLDGIRALAVASVVLFHAGIPGAGGLYMGVDGFFVLSGFLITSLLLADYAKNNKISFGSFYARRARRLFPALILLIAVVLIGEYLWGDKASFASIRGDSLAALFYVSNWYYIATHSGYFGASSLLSPLQHTWSLAIEEQFYIFWPMVIFLLFRRKHSPKQLAKIAAVGSLISAVLMAIIYGNGEGLNAAYYSTETRGQALLVGCFLAAVMSEPDNFVLKNKERLKLLGPAALFLVGLLWSFAAGPPSWMFRGGFFISDILVATVIGSAVLVTSGIITKALSTPPLVGLGKISYGVYLWMFPITQVFTAERTGFTGVFLFAIRVVFILLASMASYFFIERPIRSKHFLKLKPTAAVATFFAVLCLVAGSIGLGNISPSSGRIVISPTKAVIKGRPLRVFVAGDSVALTLGIGLGQQSYRWNVKVYDDAILGCGVMTGGLVDSDGTVEPQAGGINTCQHDIAQYANEVKTIRPDVSVLLAGRWEVMNRNYGSGFIHIGDPTFDSQLRAGLVNTINLLHVTGAPVVLLTCPYFEQLPGPNGQVLPEDQPERVDLYNQMLYSVAKQMGTWVKVIDLNAKVDPNKEFQEYIGGIQIRNQDGIHFSYPPSLSQITPNYPDGGLYVEPWLIPQLINIGAAFYKTNN